MALLTHEERLSMNVSDSVATGALVVSFMAFAASLFSLYRTYFHKKRRLKAVILDVEWDEADRETRLKLLYINDGNMTEVVSAVKLRYYSLDDWPGSFIGEYYAFGNDIPFLYDIAPVAVPAYSQKIVDHSFPLTEDALNQVRAETVAGKTVSSVLRFKRVSDRGYSFTKLYFQGLSGGDPFSYSFCPDAVVNLNKSLLDDVFFLDQHRRELEQVPPMSLAARHKVRMAVMRFHKARSRLLQALRGMKRQH